MDDISIQRCQEVCQEVFTKDLRHAVPTGVRQAVYTHLHAIAGCARSQHNLRLQE